MKSTFFVPIYEWGDPNTGCGTVYGTVMYCELNDLYGFEYDHDTKTQRAVGHFEVVGVVPLLSEFKKDLEV
jgi:hypothetical protein